MVNQERNTEATDDAMSSSLDNNLSLPMDIIFDILNRLRVKSLLRFRCVCKTFRQLISNPTFISSHLLHHRTPTTTAIATIFTFKHRTATSLSLLQSPSSSQNPINLVTPDVHFHEDLGLDSLDNMQIVMALEEEFKLEIPNKEADKIGSCFLAIE
ncbi:acyl carrier protein 1, chloroplastic-like [Camellia sinensis]|uniref:acyl carrier protein 1, chloroplastic-like n=1 Tax=Camellia sinensis TaxID=4442 RepID=UPI0010363B2C|nr:acyl carrier protein 1, chloroplastic-like [Camellia sinensis]